MGSLWLSPVCDAPPSSSPTFDNPLFETLFILTIKHTFDNSPTVHEVWQCEKQVGGDDFPEESP